MDGLDRLAAALDEPHDYFRGRSARLAALPRNVLCFQRDQPFGGRSAIHHRFVLIICLQGPGAVIVDGRLLPLRVCEGLLVFPHHGHHYGRFRDAALRWLFVTFELDDPAPLHALRAVVHGLGDEHLALLEELLAAFLSDARDAADRLALRLAELLGSLLARGVAASVADTERDESITTALAYIHDQVPEPIGVADVARHVALSPSRLRHVFKRAVGVPLGRYIRQVKLNHACSLLHDSDLSVSQIADACGFESLATFSRRFAAERGMAPSAYRRGE